MAKSSRKDILPRTQGALASASFTGNLMQLTCGQLGSDEFAQVKEIAQIIRGRWVGGKTQGFVFPDEILPEPIIKDIVISGKVPPANRYSLYPTPAGVIESLFEIIGDEIDWIDEPKILEPSAGVGGLVLAIRERYPDARITAIEIDPINVAIMQGKGIEAIEADFEKTNWEDEFDLVIMNPPFDGVACARHFNHAYRAMKKHGALACILPSAIMHRATSVESVATMMDTINRHGEIMELPSKSFAPLTNVETFIGYVAGKSNGRSGPDHVSSTLLVTMDADRDTYLQLNQVYQKIKKGIATDLLGNIIDQPFCDEITKITNNFFERNPQNFLKLNREEQEEVYQHYYRKFLESRYAPSN